MNKILLNLLILFIVIITVKADVTTDNVDKVELKNGILLLGNIHSESDIEIKLISIDGIERTIPKEMIKTIDRIQESMFSGSEHVLLKLKNETNLSGKIYNEDDNFITIIDENNLETKVPKGNIFEITYYNKINILPEKNIPKKIEQKLQKNHIGIRTGFNISSVSSTHADVKGGIHLGIFMQSYHNENIIIQPELLYSRKGWSSEGKIADNYGYIAIKETGYFDYLEINILIKVSHDAPNLSLQPHVGFSIGALINSEISVKLQHSGGLTSSETIHFNKTNPLDFGLNVGSDIILRSRVLLGLRFTYGLSNVFYEDFMEEKISNRNFMLSFGLLLK